MTASNLSPKMPTLRNADSRRPRISSERVLLPSTPEAPGTLSGKDPSNGLRRLAGAWSDDEFEHFENAVAPLGEIDDELWR